MLYGLAALALPGGRKVLPYSIQRRMGRDPDAFREDLGRLFELLRGGRIKPIIAARMPLTEAMAAHALLAGGSVAGKIVLLCGQPDAQARARDNGRSSGVISDRIGTRE